MTRPVGSLGAILPRTLPPDGTVELWILARGAGPPPERLLATLSRDDHARAARCVDPHIRDARLWSRAFQRTVLAAYIAAPAGELRFDRHCRHCGADHGKPRVQGSQALEFSASDAGTSVIVGVTRARAELGVDIEQWSSLRRIATQHDTVYSPSERARAAVGGGALLAHWVRKEALLKATGHGLAVSPASVTLRGNGDGRWTPSEAPHLAEARAWQIADVEVPGGVGAVALSQRIDTLWTRSFEGP